MTRIPTAFDQPGLETVGFEGFATIAELRSSRLEAIPAESGVYAVLWPNVYVPKFLAVSTGGWFKQRDPSVAPRILTSKWVPNASVVYIGKAGTDGGLGATLRERLKDLLDFGNGKPVGHWGGRYLWHLPRSGSLLVGWRLSAHPRAEERDLIQAFTSHYGMRPFANLVG